MSPSIISDRTLKINENNRIDVELDDKHIRDIVDFIYQLRDDSFNALEL